MHTIRSLLAAVEQHPALASLPFSSLLTFLRYAYPLKDDILQPQPHFVSVAVAPEFVPPSVLQFLMSSLDIPISDVEALWSVTGDIIWSLSPPEEVD